MLVKKVAQYIIELNRNNDAGNRSHETLAKLYKSFGRHKVDAEIKRQLDANKVVIHPNASQVHLQKCECQHDIHFTSENVHIYGAEVADVHEVKTPISRLKACKTCRETCLAKYIEAEPARPAQECPVCHSTDRNAPRQVTRSNGLPGECQHTWHWDLSR